MDNSHDSCEVDQMEYRCSECGMTIDEYDQVESEGKINRTLCLDCARIKRPGF